MTDQPTTPTVDTDELRELLDRIETVSIAFTPAGEKGDEWTPSEPHREHRYDGRCAVCRFADYPEARAQVLTAALARPVPAAPAEPGATEVDDLIQKLRAASVHPEAFESALYADAADALAALAASPAPADEGRERVFLDMEADVLVPTMLTVADEMPLGYGWVASLLRQAAALLSEAAAPPAPAVPEVLDRVPCGRFRRHEVHASHVFTIQLTDDSPEQGDVWCPGLTVADNIARRHAEQEARDALAARASAAK